MPTKDFLPSNNGELLSWATSFSAKISDSPQSVGLVASQSTQFASYLSAFSADLAVSEDPTTRTRGSIEKRRQSAAQLKAYARELARIINAFPATTNEVRLNLGLTPRKETIGPSEVPDEAPLLEVVEARGRLLKCRLHTQDSARRGKLPSAAGATIFSYIGSAPPADISLWKFEGSSTRCNFTLEFPPTVPAGAQVWLCAFWYSPTAASGPACQPITAYLAGGVSGNTQQSA
jgi:hypothetical protein